MRTYWLLKLHYYTPQVCGFCEVQEQFETQRDLIQWLSNNIELMCFNFNSPINYSIVWVKEDY